MLGAAAAVWEDLHCNHILAALLDLPTEEECSARLNDTKLDSRMSLGERDRHMEWESSSASAGTAEGQAAKGHGHKDDRHCPSSASLQPALMHELIHSVAVCGKAQQLRRYLQPADASWRTMQSLHRHALSTTACQQSQ